MLFEGLSGGRRQEEARLDFSGAEGNDKAVEVHLLISCPRNVTPILFLSPILLLTKVLTVMHERARH